MNFKQIFLTLSGFQLTWLFCIFGEYYGSPLLGFIIGILYLSIFFYFNKNKFYAFKICLIFSLIGYFFDSMLGFFEIFIIKSKISVGYLPIWFLVLWPSFTTLFVDLLLFLKNRIFLAFFMGTFLAPPTYYIGIPLGIAESNNLILSMIFMAFFWGLFLIFYTFFLNRINPT